MAAVKNGVRRKSPLRSDLEALSRRTGNRCRTVPFSGYVAAPNRRSAIGPSVDISASYVERRNLSLRIASRRFTRLTDGFSKRVDHHPAAVGLYVARHNFCPVHETLRAAPAMAQRLTDHVWTIGALLTARLARLDNAPIKPREMHRRFTVVEGGLSD